MINKKISIIKVIQANSLLLCLLFYTALFVFTSCGNQSNSQNLEQRKVMVRDSLQQERDNVQHQIDQVDEQLNRLQNHRQDRFEEVDEEKRHNWTNMYKNITLTQNTLNN